MPGRERRGVQEQTEVVGCEPADGRADAACTFVGERLVRVNDEDRPVDPHAEQHRLSRWCPRQRNPHQADVVEDGPAAAYQHGPGVRVVAQTSHGARVGAELGHPVQAPDVEHRRAEGVVQGVEDGHEE